MPSVAHGDLASGTICDEPIRLPGGYIDLSGQCHRDANLAPLDGFGEELLAAAREGACVANLTTLVLTRTVRRIGAIREVTTELIRDLVAQDRDWLLVKLREMTLGKEMWVKLVCPAVDCGKEMEARLMLDELPIEPKPLHARTFVMDLAPVVEFRLPTGRDQEAVAAEDHGSAEDLGMRLLMRCLERVDGVAASGSAAMASVSPSACKQIEQRMEELAPDLASELDAVCPECDAPFSSSLNLPWLILADMRARAGRLAREVHSLAWHYHWSEREILAMPHRKRQGYLKLVEDELEALGG